MPGLLDSIHIGSIKLPNRLVMALMATEFATKQGEVTDALITHYQERVQGIGLVIAESSYVMPAGRASPQQLGIHEDNLIPGLQRLAWTVQEHGSKAAIQLKHAGAKALPNAELGSPAGPSAIAPPESESVPRELSAEEIEGIVIAFGQAARRAKEAGFDAVEVHGAHGEINNQFASPVTNKRTDRYGGSLENRILLPLEIISEVRMQVGKDYPLVYRLGADDMVKGGLTIQDGRRIATALVEAGVDVIDVTGGLGGSEHPTIKTQGYFIPLAEKIKRVARVPVIGIGGITEPEYADRVIREGRVDMVAVGRAILNDPQWTRKAVDILSGSREPG